jgi:hypothetical protein
MTPRDDSLKTIFDTLRNVVKVDGLFYIKSSHIQCLKSMLIQYQKSSRILLK